MVTSITLGDAVKDTVTVTGLGGSFPDPTGTVDFQVKTPSVDWSTYDASVALDGNEQAISSVYTPLATGQSTAATGTTTGRRAATQRSR
ncbi:MAG: hypothetical protein AMK73_05405 [Planctomycetes bacterium SM23_32]|nr:MAG: hypothetical protein AMK73_05405 [Planctomycetes bacterium SM23_32]